MREGRRGTERQRRREREGERESERERGGDMITTVVSRASAHSRVSAHVLHFKGPL